MNPAWNARSKDFNDNAFRFKFHFAPLVFIHLQGNVAVGHTKISSTCVRGRTWGMGAWGHGGTIYILPTALSMLH